MRPLPILATGLLATALLTAYAPAQAAGETCHGQAATIVGTPGQPGLTGTEGADVVVTNGATSTYALGGNDLVCITGGSGRGATMIVDSGAGDDVVDAAGAVDALFVALGGGADTYTGSPVRESVFGGVRDFTGGGAWDDTETDTITTGAGDDSDEVISGSDRTVVNTDVVVLGGGAGGVSWFGPMGAGGRLDGGGSSRVFFTVGSGHVVVDAGAGTLSQNGATQLVWTGFDRFSTGGTVSRTPASFTFLGTARDEQLDFRFPDANDHVQHVDMGGGDDLLQLGYDDNVGAKGSTYTGGPGKDHVDVWAGTSLDLDLVSGRMETRHDGRTVRTTLTGFETQLVGAKKLVLDGTKKADELRFYSCQATVHGRGGADDIQQSKGNDYFEGGLRCKPQRIRLFGDGGNDVLRGTLGDDLLVGGRGRDTIEGNGGRDTCSGERLRSCEIKRR